MRPGLAGIASHGMGLSRLYMAAVRKPGSAAAATILAVLVFVGGLIGLSANVDRLAREREQAQAQNALQERIAEIADAILPTADWDEAVAHTANKFDLAWAKANMNFGFARTSDLLVCLVDADDRLIFSVHDGVGPERLPSATLRARATPLIARVRALEARRGPFKPHLSQGPNFSIPIQASDIIDHNGEVEIVTATLIQPDFGAVLPKGPRSAIMLTARPLDADFLKGFGQRLLLRDVRLALGARPPAAEAHIRLTDSRGHALGAITWTPPHLGRDLMSIALLPILIGVGVPLVLFRFGQRTARRLAATLDDLARARDEADAANAQKSSFLATMSHEIRTPLNGVLAMAQVMALGELSAGQRQKLSVINHSGEALLTIVNDILDLSKIEAGRMDLDPRPFDLGEMALALQALYEPVALAKGLAFNVTLAPGLEGFWRGDPDRIRQVIANLVSNALKFTETGSVGVTLSPAAPAGVRIAVADTGLGLAPLQQELVFEKFRQAEASTSRRFGGTGLGLSICRQLAELMGGRIWVTSREGAGSTFFVELPLERAMAPSPATARGEAAPADAAIDRPIRLLAADDNAVNRQVLAAILEPFGFELVLCEDGAGALQAWRSTAFDLILMDVQMPVMDGLAATRHIRAEEAASGRARTPIIALTANAMTHQLAEYHGAGMDDCVAKPIRIPELQAAVLRQLQAEEEAVDHAAEAVVA